MHQRLGPPIAQGQMSDADEPAPQRSEASAGNCGTVPPPSAEQQRLQSGSRGRASANQRGTKTQLRRAQRKRKQALDELETATFVVVSSWGEDESQYTSDSSAGVSSRRESGWAESESDEEIMAEGVAPKSVWSKCKACNMAFTKTVGRERHEAAIHKRGFVILCPLFQSKQCCGGIGTARWGDSVKEHAVLHHAETPHPWTDDKGNVLAAWGKKAARSSHPPIWCDPIPDKNELFETEKHDIGLQHGLTFLEVLALKHEEWAAKEADAAPKKSDASAQPSPKPDEVPTAPTPGGSAETPAPGTGKSEKAADSGAKSGRQPRSKTREPKPSGSGSKASAKRSRDKEGTPPAKRPRGQSPTAVPSPTPGGVPPTTNEAVQILVGMGSSPEEMAQVINREREKKSRDDGRQDADVVVRVAGGEGAGAMAPPPGLPITPRLRPPRFDRFANETKTGHGEESSGTNTPMDLSRSLTGSDSASSGSSSQSTSLTGSQASSSRASLSQASSAESGEQGARVKNRPELDEKAEDGVQKTAEGAKKEAEVPPPDMPGAEGRYILALTPEVVDVIRERYRPGQVMYMYGDVSKEVNMAVASGTNLVVGLTPPPGMDPVQLFMLPDFCLLYTSPSPRDKRQSRMPSSA